MSELTITGQGEVIAEEIPLIPTSEPETQTELQPEAETQPNSGQVCKLCGAVAVCQTNDPDGGLLCHEHAGIARSEGKDLFCVGGEVPFEYVPTDPNAPIDAGHTVTDEQGTFEVGMTETKSFTDPADAPKKLNTAKAYDSEEALQAYDRETIRLINEEAEEVKHFEREYDEAADVAKECKKSFEKAEKALRELIEERKNGRGKPQQPTLFKEPEDADAEDEDEVDTEITKSEAQPETEATVETQPEPEAENTGSGVWGGNHEFTPEELAIPLSSLSLPQGIINSLSNAVKKDGGSCKPIQTVGDYFDYLKPIANGWMPSLKDIKGIGDSKVEQIEQAILDFTTECCQRKQRQEAA